MRPALSFAALAPAVALALVLGAGCGSEIGDSCAVSLDCDPSNSTDRVCDLSSTGGYCTIIGCDHESCPDGSVCIRFYVASFANTPCDFATEDLGTNDCGPDEVCSFKGQCVPATSEVRYCMKTCESGGDCRDEYECRNEELMRAHGGEPVPPPGERITSGDLPAFCAEAPAP